MFHGMILALRREVELAKTRTLAKAEMPKAKHYREVVVVLNGEPLAAQCEIVEDITHMLTRVHITTYTALNAHKQNCKGCGAPLDHAKCEYCEREH